MNLNQVKRLRLLGVIILSLIVVVVTYSFGLVTTLKQTLEYGQLQ